jgi:glutamate-1-semialdehyde aminotransferase
MSLDPPAPKPLRRGAIAAVITNPFAGRFVPDIAPFMEELKPVGLMLARS